MQRRRLLGTVMALAATGALPAMASARDGNDAGHHVLERLNARRWDAGLRPLMAHPALTGMAWYQAQHMNRLGELTHAGQGGTTPPERGRQAGYAGRILGEALAECPGDPTETVAYWLAQSGTREVLLDPEAREVGCAGLRALSGVMRLDLVVGVRGLPDVRNTS